tara:strand:- start:5290 stop:5472 length:183 start_codon:yes stop_codon:yes gene_type:complete
MFKLILVFGVWINPYKIHSLGGIGNNTSIIFSKGYEDFIAIEGKTQDQVAQEINKQMESK